MNSSIRSEIGEWTLPALNCGREEQLKVGVRLARIPRPLTSAHPAFFPLKACTIFTRPPRRGGRAIHFELLPDADLHFPLTNTLFYFYDHNDVLRVIGSTR